MHELEALSQSEYSPPGMFSFEELVAFMQEERVQHKFAILGIEPNDAWSLYKLIDKDGTDLIEISTFLEGCMKLRGEATKLDLESLSYRFEAHANNLREFMGHVVQDQLDSKYLFDKLIAKMGQLEIHNDYILGKLIDEDHKLSDEVHTFGRRLGTGLSRDNAQTSSSI